MIESSTQCFGCGSNDPQVFFHLPRIPASVGSLAASASEAHRARCGEIRLAACERCGLIQNQVYDVDLVGFEPGYEVSLFHTPLFRQFIQGVCDRLVQRYDLYGKRILEIGCGGADFLRLICRAGGNFGVGVDPTIAGASRERVGEGTVRLIPGFFTQQHAPHIGDFICCLSVLEDIPRPLEFLQSLRACIGDRDVPIYFEVFNGFRSIEQREVWSIHYEQCNYFSLDSFVGLFERAGYSIVEAGTCFQGDQYLYVEARPATPRWQEQDFREMTPVIRRFATEHRECSERWRNRMNAWERDKKNVVLWGSGGKGISFLSTVTNSDVIDYVVDVNPERQDHFIPMTGQRIIAPAELREIRPHAVILSNPLYEREIVNQVDQLGLRPEFLVA